jgi:hypothetical protein
MDSDWELNSHNNDQDNDMAAEGYQSEEPKSRKEHAGLKFYHKEDGYTAALQD